MPSSGSDPTDPRVWLRRAVSNLVRAEQEPIRPEILLEDLCFDAQQAAEKALKGVLIHRGVEFPRTHSIRELLRLVEASGVSVPPDVGEARELTVYAVAGRYADTAETVIREEWQRAASLARRVVAWAEQAIGGTSPSSGSTQRHR